MNIRIDGPRLAAELEKLATFTDTPNPSVTRILFTDTDLKARAYFKRLATDAGFSVREDPLGNTFVRFVGADPNLPAVGTGSHIDAIPHAGRFDGTVGVLGGLEALRALKSAGFQPHRSLEVLMFTSEEPTRFGLGCLGSRILAGTFPLDNLRGLKDAEGNTVDQARTAAGMTGTLEQVCLPDNYFGAFVELHIEQGPLLEKEKLPIGVVTAIAAPAALRVTLTGEGGHAGVVLMPDRKDALSAAAEIALAVESAARNNGSIDSVATTGVCRVHPGAVNSIPSKVELEIDIRDAEKESRDRMVEKVRVAVESICKARKIGFSIEVLNADPPVKCDKRIVAAIEHSCREMSIPAKRMVSRAYHDSLFMARIAPTAMIFIPCVGGISHRPDEYSSPEEIATGAEVLARTLAQLSST